MLGQHGQDRPILDINGSDDRARARHELRHPSLQELGRGYRDLDGARRWRQRHLNIQIGAQICWHDERRWQEKPGLEGGDAAGSGEAVVEAGVATAGDGWELGGVMFASPTPATGCRENERRGESTPHRFWIWARRARR